MGLYNSTQAQILQLELRISVMQFMDEYKVFVKEAGKDVDLSKFESLVFSGIAADANNVPTAFDGLSQLVDAYEKVKKANRP